MATSERAGRAQPAEARGARAPVPAYVLHHYDWSESSVILDLFTRPFGRLAVVAKGAKRPYSQLRAVLLPFQRLSVSVGTRREPEQAEVHVLRSAEWAASQPMLSGEPLLTGFYLNELLMKGLARQDAHPVVFDAYDRTLPALALDDDAAVQAALRAFELILLREMGVLPELARLTSTQQPVQAARRYTVRADAGVLPAAERDESVPGEVLRLVQSALDDGDLASLRKHCRTALTALKPMLRALLHYHLGTAALRTRQVMVDVQRLLA
jgi:DNA repair protein RecO (recombination protein O)